MEEYQRIADLVSRQIAAGSLRPGDRLSPQREFARRQRIAPSTAARVYRELGRRGLTTGEVGRGTFVRASEAPPCGPALSEPARAPVDLELNYPVVAQQATLLAAGVGPLLRAEVLGEVMRPVGPFGTSAARQATAELVSRGGWRPRPDQIVFTGNGRQALAAALAATVPAGGRLGAEKLTYPALRTIAGQLGLRVVPLGIDRDGVLPEAVEAAQRAAPLHAVYLQPTVHNPLGVTLSGERRAALARILGASGIPLVEDAVWGFLHDGLPPLAALLPERSIVVDSLSKRLAPGLTTGFAIVPPDRRTAVAAAVRSSGHLPARFALEAATRWMTDGSVRSVVRAKQRDAAARQRVAARELAGQDATVEPLGYSCWWRLPPPWRAEPFVAAAARQGIAVTPAGAFHAGGRGAPQAVRLALASPPVDDLTLALRSLAELAAAGPPG